MKKHHLAAITTLSLVVAMPAFAGPNWDVIRASEQHASQEHDSQIILPLDHGPRALSTPWINKQEKFEMVSREQKAQSVRVAAHAAKHTKTRTQ